MLLSNLATILQDLGELAAARQRMRAAIAIWDEHLAADHPTLGKCYRNLATIDFAQGYKAAACAGFRRALVILCKSFDEFPPHVQRVRRSMQTVGCGD